jgi:hypothetical protein
MVNGRLIEKPMPHLEREFLNRAIPLPNVRDIKKRTAHPLVRALVDEETRLGKPGYHAQAIADFITQDVFVPLRLLRVGFVLRNVAEAQMRMSTAGYDSMLGNNPLSYVAWRFGERGKKNALGEDFAELDDVAGGLSQYGRALSRNGDMYTTRSGKRATAVSYETVAKTDENFTKSWLSEMAWVAGDDIGKAVLNMPLDDAKAWFYAGEGRKFLDDLMESEGFARKYGAGRAGADAYVDTVFQRLQTVTGQRPELLEMLRMGRLGKEQLFRNGRLNTRLLPMLDNYLDDAPEAVRGKTLRSEMKEDGRSGWRQFVDAGMDLVASRPERFFNQDPLFRQAYWRRQAEMTNLLSRDAQQELLAAARAADQPAPVIKEIEKRIAMGTGQLTVKDADFVANAHALKTVRRTLYTSYDKLQGLDTLRAVFIFGDALRNTARTWTRLVAQNPVAPIKFGQRYYQGAKDADLNGDGEGFFYYDEQYRQERFALPGSGWMIEQATGAELGNFTAPVEGLNLLTQSVVPSLGPVSSVSAAFVIPDRAEYDRLKETFMPYGESTLSQQILPPAIHKVYLGLTKGEMSQSDLNNYSATKTEVIRHLLSSGDYDLSDTEQVADLQEDAQRMASRLFLIRGAAQFVAPSAPSPKFMAYDKDGKLWETFELARIYREQYNSRDMQGFLEDFGQLAIGSAVGKTENEGTSPANKQALDFARANPGTVRAHKDVYGLFIGSDGAFDYAAYERQIDSGERKVKTGEQFVEEVRSRLANTIMEEARRVYADDPDQVRKVKAQLETAFQFNPQFTGNTKGNILKLLDAVKDPNLASTEAGQGLQVYLKARERALAEAQQAGIVDLKTNKKARPLRLYLAQVGNRVVDEYPQFADMWERVWSKEIGAVA